MSDADDWIAALPEPRRSDIAAIDARIRAVAPALRRYVERGFLAYGRYHYRGASKREGEWFVLGIASNKAYISLYASPIGVEPWVGSAAEGEPGQRLYPLQADGGRRSRRHRRGDRGSRGKGRRLRAGRRVTRRRIPDDVLSAAHARATARAAGEWDEADRLRAEIEAAGWKIADRGTDFALTPAAPPDVAEGERIRYGSSASVPARWDEPATGLATVVLDRHGLAG